MSPKATVSLFMEAANERFFVLGLDLSETIELPGLGSEFLSWLKTEGFTLKLLDTLPRFCSRRDSDFRFYNFGKVNVSLSNVFTFLL
jgi:hypothetical protein